MTTSERRALARKARRRALHPETPSRERDEAVAVLRMFLDDRSYAVSQIAAAALLDVGHPVSGARIEDDERRSRRMTKRAPTP